MNTSLASTSCNGTPESTTAIASVADLATHVAQLEFDAVRELYDIRSICSTPLIMSQDGWAATAEVMDLPREQVENQVLTLIRDRVSGHEAIVNSVRSRRNVPSANDRVPARVAGSCRWCEEWNVSQSDLWSDLWGATTALDGRIGTRPNWARQSAISGLAFGDERMHELDSLSEPEFVGLFEAGEQYLARARQSHPGARFCTLFLNGGPKSAGSVEHAHVQIAAREDMHFAYPELIAERGPRDYWLRVSRAHEQAGLSIRGVECTAWVSLAPVKERDFTMLSENVQVGARSAYRIWRALAQHGTRNFSLAAILSPGYVTGIDCPEHFAQWPNVVWRFVDRGDPEVKHADIGTMELFASSVVANDPYIVAALLDLPYLRRSHQ